MSSKGVDQRFHAELDDEEQLGDGIDATRAVLLVTDEYGNPRPFATGAVELTLEGQGEIVGEHPFALVGGAGAVWLKTGEVENDGTLILRAKHQVLGTKTVSLRVIGTPKEITGVHGLTQEQKTARPPREEPSAPAAWHREIPVCWYRTHNAPGYTSPGYTGSQTGSTNLHIVRPVMTGRREASRCR